MRLSELSKNIDKINNKEELNRQLDKYVLSILKVIKNDPEYYKDKEYAKVLVMSNNKPDNTK